MTAITTIVSAKMTRYRPVPPGYFPASARMIAERAEQGTKVISTEAMMRSRPLVTFAAAEMAERCIPARQKGHGDHTVQAIL